MRRVVTFLALVVTTPLLLVALGVVWLVASVGVLFGTHDFYLDRREGSSINPTIRRRCR